MKFSTIIALLCLVLSSNLYAATGMLKVKTESGSAKIWIDGRQEKDATEQYQVYELSPGNHIIRAEKQYYSPQERRVTIRANEVAPPLIFQFNKASGFKIDRANTAMGGQGRGDLTIITDKPGATVSLNGRTITEDVTPITIRDLGEGEWEVTVELQGKKQKDAVLIRPGKLATMRFFYSKKSKQEYITERKELERKRKEDFAKRENERNEIELEYIREEIRRNNPKTIRFKYRDFKHSYNNNDRKSSEKWNDKIGGWRIRDSTSTGVAKYSSDLFNITFKTETVDDFKETVTRTSGFLNNRSTKYRRAGVVQRNFYINDTLAHHYINDFSSKHDPKNYCFEWRNYSVRYHKTSSFPYYEVTIKNYDDLVNDLAKTLYQK